MSTIKTTIKTDICSFTEYRIYPGRGKKFIAKDGKVHIYVGSKASRLARQKVKPVRLMWTQAWRRNNKKMKTEGTHKRRTRKTGRIQKAIVGLSLEEFKKKKAQKPEIRQAVLDARETALKEAREKRQKNNALKKTAQSTQKHPVGAGKKDVALKSNVPKGNVHKTQGGRKK